jgi:type II secretory pathway pseudopilin PulG
LRCWNRLQEIKKGTLSAEGFTLIETLIAGLLLTLVMTAVGRMSVSALAGSSNISDRRRIEQAIENHIQLIQQADSLLTYDNVPATHRNGAKGITRACRKPAEYLATALAQKGLITNTSEDDWRLGDEVAADPNFRLFPSFPEPGREMNGDIINTAIKETDYSYDEDKAIVTITYTFEAPEENVGIEKRVLELSPNFQSECTPYEATGA